MFSIDITFFPYFWKGKTQHSENTLYKYILANFPAFFASIENVHMVGVDTGPGQDHVRRDHQALGGVALQLLRHG